MYVAYALGAPGGSALYATYGFSAIAVATTLVPLVTLLLVAPLAPVPASPHARPAVKTVLRAVWLPGLGLALSSVGFGAITIFVALLFAQYGWSSAWIALTAVSVSFIVGRLALGHLPDRIGGPTVALISVLVEAAGLTLIWLAGTPALVFAGSALAGLGYALVYPAFGVETVRRAPPANRGLAMGAYTACLDLALGVASPVLGLIAGAAGLKAVFLASALTISCAALVALPLMKAAKQDARGKTL
jgi:predicted MFS family arabinose efflux permease